MLFSFQFPGQECYPRKWLIWLVTDSLEATNWANHRHPNIRCFLQPLLTQSFQSAQFSQLSSVMSDSLQPHGLQHTRLPCSSPTPRACSNSRPLSQWYHATVSPSVVPFFFCPQSFPATGSFPMSQFFTSGDQRIGVSAIASVLVNIQDWFL